AANMADGGFTRVPANDEINLNSQASYVHITTNETIEGVQWKTEPDVGSVPLLADASSDILSHRIPEGLHTMLDFKTHVENNSLYNTPNTWGIYIIDLVCKWLKDKGGLAAMERENDEKSKLLYDAIDKSSFYRGHADADARSTM